MNIFRKSLIAISCISCLALSACMQDDMSAIPSANTSMTMADKLDNTVLILTKEVVIDKQTNQSVEVLSGDGSGWFRKGTNEIITAAHVIDGAKTIQIVLHDGRKFNASVVYENKSLDLAELQIVNYNDTPLPSGFSVCPVSPQSGDELTLIGNPLGFTWIVHKGIVSNPDVTDNVSLDAQSSSYKIDAMAVDMLMQPGFSGGPLITDDGCVAGVADFDFQVTTGDVPQEIAFAATTDELNQFLKYAADPASAPQNQEEVNHM
jgi:S1-C subfamily serine protease